LKQTSLHLFLAFAFSFLIKQLTFIRGNFILVFIQCLWNSNMFQLRYIFHYIHFLL